MPSLHTRRCDLRRPYCAKQQDPRLEQSIQGVCGGGHGDVRGARRVPVRAAAPERRPVRPDIGPAIAVLPAHTASACT